MSAITALSTNYQQPPSNKDDTDTTGNSGKSLVHAHETPDDSTDDSVQLSPLVMESLNKLHQVESNLTDYELLLSTLATSLKSAAHPAYSDAYSTVANSAYI